MTETVPIDIELLARLADVSAPSGREQPVAEILGAELTACGAEISHDEAGNLHATLPGHSDELTLVSHMDEVGLVVRHVRPDGFVLVDRVGGIGRRSLPAREIRLLGERGPVDGLVGVLSHHLTPREEYHSVPPVESTYVDVGAASAQEVAALGIGVGTRGTFASSLVRLGGDAVRAKALDNRALCYVLVAVARMLASTPDRRAVRFVGTVREEFDFAGAAHLARTLSGSTIVLDVSPAHDTPELEGVGVALGRGPVLKHQDFHGRGPLAGYIASQETVRAVRAAAGRAAVELQEEVQTGLATDAAQLVEATGQASLASIALPIRYTHSAAEVARLADLAATIRLVHELVRSFPRDTPAEG